MLWSDNKKLHELEVANPAAKAKERLKNWPDYGVGAYQTQTSQNMTISLVIPFRYFLFELSIENTEQFPS